MKKNTPRLYKNTLILLFTLFLSAFSSPVIAGHYVNIDGLSFDIARISNGEWAKPRHHMINDMVEHPDNTGEVLSYIAISYTVNNTNESKKVDLDGTIEYQLFDEFGNRYRAMRKPDNYKTAVLSVSKNFPSLYPGEQYGETLFFEAPIAKARTLKLLIAAESLKLSRPVELVFERDLIPSMRQEQSLPATEIMPVTQDVSSRGQEQNVLIGSAEIRIASPDPGVVWDQGQSARVEVVIPGRQSPKNIILIALNNTYNDAAPKVNNVYDINVPSDQAPGEYLINVIAQWPDGSTSSAVLKFFVKDATPLGLL